MTVPARINVVTLGVADVGRATAFYEALGWPKSTDSNEAVSFFDLGAVVLGLYGRGALAEDAQLPDDHRDRFGGMALAINVASPAEVDSTLTSAVTSGATLLKPGQSVFWGGYSGYFADLDGHPWEVAHNPGWSLGADGHIELP